jgi:AICAR transformylase/IMP cyclohydrolase PurH
MAGDRERKLKYGLNPHQQPARLLQPEAAPLEVLNGTPGFINLLDAINAWRLVQELRAATSVAAAACFKHVSPAGAAIAGALPEAYLRSQFLEPADLSPVANAYVRARGGDRMCAFGDFAAVSDVVDESLADVLMREVSDGIIAPGYTPAALARLARKKGGAYLVLRMDPDFVPPAEERREVFGLTLEQANPPTPVTSAMFGRRVSRRTEVPEGVLQTLLVATVALKYAQSNSVCVAYDGQVVGLGAGQQSRVHCTRLACDKAEKWFLAQHPKTLALPFAAGLKRPDLANVVDQFLLWDQLSPPERAQLATQLDAIPAAFTAEEKAAWLRTFDGVCLSSDAFLPFRDNVDRAARSNVRYVAQAGGSNRDDEVTAAADSYDMVMIHTGMRWFLH